MRIAINTRFLLAGKLEGMGRFIQEFCKHWVEAHPEHEYIFLFDRAYDEQFLFGKDVEARVVWPPARHPFLWYLWYEWALPRALDACRADVFVSPDNFLSLRAKQKTLLVVHDIAYRHFPEQVPFWPRKYYQHYMPKYLARAERIATVSRYSKADMQKQYSVSGEKIDLVGAGGSSLFSPIAAEERQATRQRYAGGQPYWLYVGSVHPRKNLLRMLQAYELYCEQSGSRLPFLVAGRMAWQHSEVGLFVEQMRYKEQLQFLGYVEEKELRLLLGAAFASLYVSLFEGFGLPILEAMQAGVPVISSLSSSMPEVGGDAALLVDPYSVADIAAAMQRLSSDAQLWERCKSLGLEQAQRFSWEQTSEALYTSLLRVVEG